MREITELQKWNVVAQCLLRYDRNLERLENGALEKLEIVFAYSYSQRTIKRVFKEFQDQKDNVNINLSPKKKGVVGKKQGLTDELAEIYQQKIDDSEGLISYQEITKELQVRCLNLSLINIPNTKYFREKAIWCSKPLAGDMEKCWKLIKRHHG